ncbi:hypothetical protein Pcinc_041801 [Petrolisthes cinctipes]|uniref:Uncharacterized protein n=1 Tax=Petrolisthes cinctipes TaxID=88211 RepID=A0AAE1EHF9_PETCI|nr:hypothetical protein Pcinc_041801 [Petrolisthes cinctipes]
MVAASRCGQREGKGSRCMGPLSVCLVRMNRGSGRVALLSTNLLLILPHPDHLTSLLPLPSPRLTSGNLLTKHMSFLLSSPLIGIFSPHLYSPIFMSHSLQISSYFICYDATIASPHAF